MHSQLSLLFTGVVTILMFWGMVEVGVALIAACLPTFRPFLRFISIQSIISSVRSALSLRRLNSGSKSGYVSSQDFPRTGSDSSDTGIIHHSSFSAQKSSREQPAEMYTMKSIYGTREPPVNVNLGEIRIRNDIVQSVQEV